MVQRKLKTVADYLRAAKKIIDTPEKVVHNPKNSAEDRYGNWVFPDSEQACRFCLMGCLWQVYEFDAKLFCAAGKLLAGARSQVLQGEQVFDTLIDSIPKNHAWMMAIYDKAIEFAEVTEV